MNGCLKGYTWLMLVNQDDLFMMVKTVDWIIVNGWTINKLSWLTNNSFKTVNKCEANFETIGSYRVHGRQDWRRPPLRYKTWIPGISIGPNRCTSRDLSSPKNRLHPGGSAWQGPCAKWLVTKESISNHSICLLTISIWLWLTSG